MQRIHIAGRIHEVTEETLEHFRDVLPPRLIGRGWFVFAEGQDPLQFFWSRRGKHYARRLSDEEIDRVCIASGLPRDYRAY